MRKNILIFGHNDATQFIDIYNQYTRLFDPAVYRVTVAYLTGKPSQQVKDRTLAEEIIFLDIPKSQIRMLKIQAIRRLLKLTRERNFDIVICHRYKPSYIMMWVAQFHRIPALVFVMHELKTMSSFGRKAIIAALNRSNMIFAGVSNAVRDDIRRDLWFIPSQRIVTLYNVIDMDLTEPMLLSRQAAREALNLNENEFVVGNIARLAPNKDHHSLIQSFAAFHQLYPNSKLVLIGDGDLEPTIKQEINSLGLMHAVKLTGFLPQAFRYMTAFDCFALSSIQEAFGRVLLEAMIAKLPVIATSVHGIPEVLGNTGMLLQPRDTAGLTAAMQRIANMSTSERQRFAQLGYEHVANQFSIPSFKQFFWQLPALQSREEIQCA